MARGICTIATIAQVLSVAYVFEKANATFGHEHVHIRVHIPTYTKEHHYKKPVFIVEHDHLNNDFTSSSFGRGYSGKSSNFGKDLNSDFESGVNPYNSVGYSNINNYASTASSGHGYGSGSVLNSGTGFKGLASSSFSSEASSFSNADRGDEYDYGSSSYGSNSELGSYLGSSDSHLNLESFGGNNDRGVETGSYNSGQDYSSSGADNYSSSDIFDDGYRNEGQTSPYNTK